MVSVNTNYGASIALQNLNTTNRELGEVQNRISTGLRVSSARDDGAAFAIAQSLRSRSSSVNVINEGITRATNTVDTALSAGNDISKILNELTTEAQRAATLTNVDDRQAAQDAFNAKRNSIDGIIRGASINGVNLLDGSRKVTGFAVVTSDQGTSSSNQTVQQITGAQASDTLVTSIATFSASTAIVGRAAGYDLTTVGALAAGINVSTGDKLSFQLKKDDGSNDGAAIEVTISNFATLGALAQGIKDATGGKVNLGFNGDRLTYDSDQLFSVNFAPGVDGADGANNADDDATFNARAQFFGFGSAAPGFTDATTAGTYAASDVDSVARQTGTGNQVASTAITSIALTASTSLRSLITTGQTTGNVSLVINTGTANAETVNFDLARDVTVGQFLNEVSERTGGRVTAALDSKSDQIVFKTSSTTETLTLNGTNSQLGNALAADANSATITRTATGANFQTIKGDDFRVAGGALAALAGLDLVNDAASAKTTLEALGKSLNGFLGKLGAESKALETQQTFLGSLRDNLDRSIGGLVDADLAKESARLQALQTKQQLGTQALSIANQASQSVLSLFR